MLSRRFRLLSFVAISVWLSACSSSGEPTPGGTAPKLKPIIPQHVHLLDGSDTDHANVGNDQIAFPAAGNKDLFGYKAGDIIVGRRQTTKTGNNPYGFMRKVLSVKQVGDKIVISTKRVSLEEAIEQGEAQISQKITLPSRFDEGATTAQQSFFPAPGLNPQDTGGAAGGQIDITGTIIPGLGGGVNATLTRGMFNFDPDIDVGIKFKHHKLQEFHALFTGNLQTELALKLTGSVSSAPSWKSYKAQVYKVDKPLPLLWVGWLPVEVTMVVKVSVGVEAKVKHSFSAEAGGGVKGHVKLGGRYDAASGWSGVSEAPFTPYAIGPNLDYKADLEFKAMAPIVEMEFLIYDTAGPSIEVDPYAMLHTEISTPCPWDLSVGSEGYFIGEAQVPVLGKSIGSVQFKLFDFNNKLKEGHFPGCEQPDAGSEHDSGTATDAGAPQDSGTEVDSGSGADSGGQADGGAEDGGNSCSQLAQKKGWKHPYCETGGNKACKGHGPATSDCDHCCEGTSCGDLADQNHWTSLRCEKTSNEPGGCGSFGTPTWDCESCCGSTCTEDTDCKSGTVCAATGWGYCCQKKGAQGETCFSAEECTGDQACAWNGEKFVCTVPACTDLSAAH